MDHVLIANKSKKMDFHYACRDLGSGFAATAVFEANTPLFGTLDAFGTAAVVTGIMCASAC